MNFAEIKGTLNSTLGENKFEALNDMISKDTSYPNVVMNEIQTLPTGNVTGCAFSPDNRYCCVVFDAAPGILLYENQNDQWVSIPIEALKTNGTSCTFSNSGKYLVATFNGKDSYFYIYKYKNSTEGYIRIEHPPASYNCLGCTFSPDDNYLVITGSSTMIFKRDGDAFTQLANPSLPTNYSRGCSFDPTGIYLAISFSLSPYLAICKRDGDTFTRLSNPSSRPTGLSFDCDFSPDGHLAVSHNNYPYVTIYKRVGDVFTKLSGIDRSTKITVNSICYSKDGKYLYVAAPYSGQTAIFIYKVEGDRYINQPDPLFTPLGGSESVAISNDNKYLALGFAINPFIYIFKSDNYNLLDLLENIHTQLILKVNN